MINAFPCRLFSTSAMRSIKASAPIAAVLLLACALFLFRVNKESLWIDEAFSYWTAKRPFAAKDWFTRPAYYAALRLWLVLGESEFTLRLLSVCFGLLTVFYTFRLGGLLFSRAVGIAAALMLTVSVQFVLQSQTARMYSMGAFLALAGSFALARALLGRGDGIGCWAALRFVLLLTIPLAITMLIADVVVLFAAAKDRTVLRRALVHAAVVFVLWIPFGVSLALTAPVFVQKSGLATLGAFDVLHRALFYFTVPIAGALPKPGPAAFEIALCLLCGSALFRRRLRASAEFWLAAWTAIPVCSLALLSWYAPKFGLLRYSMFVQPYFLLLCAAAAARLSRPGILCFIGFAYACLAAMSLHHYYETPRYPRWREAIAYIRSREAYGDKLLVAGATKRASAVAAYYYRGPMKIIMSGEPDKYGRMAKMPKGGRLWLVTRQSNDRALKAALKRGYRVVHSHPIWNFNVLLLSHPEGLSEPQACLLP